MIILPEFAPQTLLPWCLVRTKYRMERTVQAELAVAGWATYMPMRITCEGPKGKKRRVSRPLFPNYLFAACDLLGDVAAPAGMKRSVVAVRRGQGGKPYIRPSLMLRLMCAERAGGFDETLEAVKVASKASFSAGDKASMLGGPLHGFEVLIVTVLSKREVRARVLMWGEWSDEATVAVNHIRAA